MKVSIKETTPLVPVADSIDIKKSKFRGEANVGFVIKQRKHIRIQKHIILYIIIYGCLFPLYTIFLYSKT